MLQIESMETDPYNILGNVRARTANELLHAFGHIAQHEAELELPIYAHHGTKDRLANLGVRPLSYASIIDSLAAVGSQKVIAGALKSSM